MPSPERAIAEIVSSHWDATAQLATDVPGNLHWELLQGPADGSPTTRPYCVYDMSPGGTNRPMAGTTEELVVRKVRFQVYGLHAQVKTALATIRDAYNRAQLDHPTGGQFISCVPTEGGGLVTEQWQRDGEQVWRGTVCFNVRVMMN